MMTSTSTSSLFQPGYALPTLEECPELIEQTNFISRAHVLETCMRIALRVPGEIMEFGVATGASTRVIRRALARAQLNLFLPFRHKRIFACDSFKGLPEAFENAAIGTFAGPVPSIRGVTFVKGYFEDSLTEALRQKVKKVAFAHLDADLYSSTLHVLKWLTPLLGTGSLLLFDEFIGGEHAEKRAFDEWREASGVTVVRLAEFDRDPSGHSTVGPDRRILFQVIRPDSSHGQVSRPSKSNHSSLVWKISYYLGRLGLDELKSRFDAAQS